LTVVYDAIEKRAMHVETGLSVTFLHYVPYMAARDAHFVLSFGGREYPFEAGYDYGEHKIIKALPDIDASEWSLKICELNEKNFWLVGGIDLSSLLKSQQDVLPRIFVEAWYRAVFEYDAMTMTPRKLSVMFETSFKRGWMRGVYWKSWICSETGVSVVQGN
jgi:hypothetical protein